MFIFRKESQILRNVNFFYCNKRCLRSDTLQHALCLVAERTIRFRVKLELDWDSHTLKFSTSRQKSHALFTPITVDSVIESCWTLLDAFGNHRFQTGEKT